MKQAVLTAGVFAAMALVVSGCGGSSAHRRPGTSASERTIKYLGGPYTLASDRVPEGAAFSIAGQRYSFWGHDYIELTVNYAKPERVEEGNSGWQSGEVLELGTHAGCEGHPFTILNGILKAPQDTVFLSIAGKSIALRKTDLPPGLGYHGALVYGIAPKSQYSVLIRTPAGKVINESGVEFAGPSDACHQAQQASRRNAIGRASLHPMFVAIASCLRREGFDVSAPSAHQLGFDAHGVNTHSSSFL
ncbi:MAG: hypothetical protein ACRDK2_13390, partial [Solirubrobacteraceae bacterium]